MEISFRQKLRRIDGVHLFPHAVAVTLLVLEGCLFQPKLLLVAAVWVLLAAVVLELSAGHINQEGVYRLPWYLSAISSLFRYAIYIAAVLLVPVCFVGFGMG